MWGGSSASRLSIWVATARVSKSSFYLVIFRGALSLRQRHDPTVYDASPSTMTLDVCMLPQTAVDCRAHSLRERPPKQLTKRLKAMDIHSLLMLADLFLILNIQHIVPANIDAAAWEGDFDVRVQATAPSAVRRMLVEEVGIRERTTLIFAHITARPIVMALHSPLTRQLRKVRICFNV